MHGRKFASYISCVTGKKNYLAFARFLLFPNTRNNIWYRNRTFFGRREEAFIWKKFAARNDLLIAHRDQVIQWPLWLWISLEILNEWRGQKEEKVLLRCYVHAIMGLRGPTVFPARNNFTTCLKMKWEKNRGGGVRDRTVTIRNHHVGLVKNNS